MTAVGIDLGTTYSGIGCLNPDGIPTSIPDLRDGSQFRTPSLLHPGPHGCLVGNAVAELLDHDPTLSVVRFPRLALGNPRPVLVEHRGQAWSPEAINALLLRKLRKDAEGFSGQLLTSAVLTVPAHFDDAARRATRRAALLAGIPATTLVDEPVAAASYFGSLERREQTLLVYDLGGDTFNATVVRCSEQEFSVLAVDGHERLGGLCIDERLAEVLLAARARAHGSDGFPAESLARESLRLAERLKLKLCRLGLSQVRQALLLGNVPFEFVLNVHHLNQIVAPQISLSLDIAERCLGSIQMNWTDVDAVMLVGGSTLIPLVRELVATRLGKSSDRVICRQPQQAVVYGAAQLAAQAAGIPAAKRLPRLRSVVSAYDLGVRIRDPRSGTLAIYKLIERNTPIPAKASKVFFTTRDDQTSIVVELVQCRADANSARSLGHFSYGPIAHPRAKYPVEVTVACDVEGLIHASARDPRTGQNVRHTLSSEGKNPSVDVSPAERSQIDSVAVLS